jgi:hypothetical protein
MLRLMVNEKSTHAVMMANKVRDRGGDMGTSRMPIAVRWKIAQRTS